MDKHYLYLKKIFINDKIILNELETLYKYNPKLLNSKIDILTVENIKKYGINALTNAIIYDKCNLLKNPMKKLKCFLELTPKLSELFYYCDNISEEDYKILGKYSSNINFFNILCSNSLESSALDVVNILKNKEYTENLLFITKYFYIKDLDDRTFLEPKFNDFIKLIDRRYINKFTSLKRIYTLFNFIKNNIQDIKTNEDKKKFNNYIFAKDYLHFSFNLDTYYDDRKKSIENQTIFRNKYELSLMISIVYFGVNFSQLQDIIEDANSLQIPCIQLFDNILSINDCLDLFYKESTIGLDLLDLEKSKSKDSIIEKLKINPIIRKNNIVKLDGQNFSLLVHKIAGLSNPDYANNLHIDPSFWNSKYEENGYVSTSLISNNHLGIFNSDGYILGFENVKKEQILQMGPTDIFTNKKMISNSCDNEHTRYMSANSIIENTFSVYNEIVLKRYNKNKDAIMPTSVIALDQYNLQDEKVSKHFNIPIYEINTKIYFDKLLKKYHYLINHREFKLAANLIITMVIGFNTSYYAKIKFLNDISLSEEIYKITKIHMDVSKENIDYLINRIDKAIILLNMYNTETYDYDLKVLKRGL